jgi:phosphatidyl-myo-inositol dimannoside synthase
MMGEIARRYPADALVVSTGSYRGSETSDREFPQTIDRVGTPAPRLRTVQGLARWTARAVALADRRRVGFTWCAELKPAAYPAWWLRTRRGIPYGIIMHGSELLLLDDKIRRSRARRWIGRALLGGAAVIVANSSWTGAYARRLLAAHGLEPDGDRVRVVPLGTDPRRFRPGLDAAAVRRKYGLDGGPWLLTVARLEWHKGIDTVVRALPAVLARHPDARYAVAGIGSADAYLQRLAADAGVRDRVRFLGHVPDDELPFLYNAADVFVLASRRHDLLVEGFGIAAVEASACGIPVVGGFEGGVRDAVRDGETGVLTDPYDADAVASAVNRLLADDDLRRRLGAGGRRAVETYFNWDRVASDIAAIDAERRRPGAPGALLAGEPPR